MAIHNIEESNSSLSEGINLEESDLSVKQSVFLKSLLDIGYTKLVEGHIKVSLYD